MTKLCYKIKCSTLFERLNSRNIGRCHKSCQWIVQNYWWLGGVVFVTTHKWLARQFSGKDEEEMEDEDLLHEGCSRNGNPHESKQQNKIEQNRTRRFIEQRAQYSKPNLRQRAELLSSQKHERCFKNSMIWSHLS